MNIFIMASVPALMLIISLSVFARGKKTKFINGGIYSIKHQKGYYGVLKIINTTQYEVGVMIYTKVFQNRPHSARLEAIIEEPKFTDVNKGTLESWEPQLIGKADVKDQEINRYLLLKRAS